MFVSIFKEKSHTNANFANSLSTIWEQGRAMSNGAMVVQILPTKQCKVMKTKLGQKLAIQFMFR